MNACVQPTADRAGRLVRLGADYVRCGRPADWSCFLCSDPLCETCAHDSRWNHYARKAA